MDHLEVNTTYQSKHQPSPELRMTRSPTWSVFSSPRSSSWPFLLADSLQTADEGLVNYLHVRGSDDYIRVVDQLYKKVQNWVLQEHDFFGEDDQTCCPTETYEYNPSSRHFEKTLFSLAGDRKGLYFRGSARMTEEKIKKALLDKPPIGWRISLDRRDSHKNFRIVIERAMRVRSISGSLQSIAEEK